MKRRELKKHILTSLQEKPWPAVAEELARFQEKVVINHLFTALCHPNEFCKWHGVSGFGTVVASLAQKDAEAARIVMRRFLWNLNDESGGIGWGIPEAMGEVMAHNDMLFDEYHHMLLSYMREDGPEIYANGNYLELPALQRGVLWGVARLIDSRPQEMIALRVAEDVCKYLSSDDQVVRAMASWCIGLCGEGQCLEAIKALYDNPVVFTFYWHNTFEEISVGAMAQRALSLVRLS